MFQLVPHHYYCPAVSIFFGYLDKAANATIILVSQTIAPLCHYPVYPVLKYVFLKDWRPESFSIWPWTWGGKFSNCRYRYWYQYFQNFPIDIDFFKKFLLIFCQYWYFQNKCQYLSNISKNADISIFHKKQKKLKNI